MRPRLAFAVAVALGLGLAPAVGGAGEPGHPRLLFTAAELPSLEARASVSPWGDMAAGAITASATAYQDRTQDASVSSRAERMTTIVDAAALAYVVDPPNRATYVARIYSALRRWDDLHVDRSTDHSYVVGAGSAFFASVLALDLVHDALTTEQRAEVEADLALYADWLPGATTAWAENRDGVLGIWALYRGDDGGAASAAASYRALLEGDLRDGVYTPGPGYADARFGARRLAKAHFVDVASFTGIDDWNADPGLRAFQEWLYAGALTPLRGHVSFGDTDPFQKVLYGNGHAPAYRVARYSPTAAAHAAWAIDGEPPRSTFLNYVLQDAALPEPATPTSRIWEAGAASFWEPDASGRGLLAALWSPTGGAVHAHKDVNAIHLTGYGEELVRNSGYAGYGLGCAGASWAWVHDTAEANNVVLVDGADHVSKVGGGIDEGFTSLLFDYARGDSGSALGDASHRRGLVLVHPQDERGGYTLLFDEVAGAPAGGTVNLVLHPSSATASEATDDTDFRWTIRAVGTTDVDLAVFLGTPPTSTTLRTGALCSFDADRQLAGQYLVADYVADAAGEARFVSVLFPSDPTHPPATMTRISAEATTGARVDLGGGVVDIAIESDGAAPVAIEEATLQATAAAFRTVDGALAWMFVRGVAFDDGGGAARNGFEADAPIALHLRGSDGHVTSAGATVTFFAPEVGAVELDGAEAPPLATDEGSVTVALPAGTYALRLLPAGPEPDPDGTGGAGQGGAGPGQAAAGPGQTGAGPGQVGAGPGPGVTGSGGAQGDGGGGQGGATSDARRDGADAGGACGCRVAAPRPRTGLMVGGLTLLALAAAIRRRAAITQG